MAEAKRNTETVTKLVEIKEEVDSGIVLTLTNEEASVLLALTLVVAGDPSNSSRKYTSDIGQSLLDAGVRYAKYAENNQYTPSFSRYALLNRSILTGGVTFTDKIKEN